MTLQFVFVWKLYQIVSVESKREVLLGETLTLNWVIVMVF